MPKPTLLRAGRLVPHLQIVAGEDGLWVYRQVSWSGTANGAFPAWNIHFDLPTEVYAPLQ